MRITEHSPCFDVMILPIILSDCNSLLHIDTIKSVVTPATEFSTSVFRGKEIHVELKERCKKEYFMDVYPLGKERRHIFGHTPMIRYHMPSTQNKGYIDQLPHLLSNILEHWGAKMDEAKKHSKLNTTDEKLLAKVVPWDTAMWTYLETHQTQYPEMR